MSSFLETNTEPGQKTLSAFLKKDRIDPAAKPAQPQHGRNQTFLGRETCEELAKQMQEHRSKQGKGHIQQADPAPHEEASVGHSQEPPGASAAPSSHSEQLEPSCNAAAAGTVLSQAAAGPGEVQSQRVPQPSQATQMASQPLELTLRDWQPCTASQLVRGHAQQPGSQPRPEHAHQSGQGILHPAPGRHEQSSARAGAQSEQQHPGGDDAHGASEAAEGFAGDLSTCRDVLDTADEAGEPDLAHAWEEEPAGIGDADDDAHHSDAPVAAAKVASAPRTWACQVCM